MKRIPKTILLLSGGLDSTCLLYQINEQRPKRSLSCLLFDYRQRHAQELLWAKQHALKLGVPFTVLQLPELGGQNEQSWIVPNRNMVFLSVAVNVACQQGASEVCIGCNAADESYFPDCREAFIEQFNATVKLAGCDVRVTAPFLHKTKEEIGGLAKGYGITKESVWACYQPATNNGPCGKCPACLKLNEAYVESI